MRRDDADIPVMREIHDSHLARSLGWHNQKSLAQTDEAIRVVSRLMTLHGCLQLARCIWRWSGPYFDEVETDNGDERLVEADGHDSVYVLPIADTVGDFARVSL